MAKTIPPHRPAPASPMPISPKGVGSTTADCAGHSLVYAKPCCEGRKTVVTGIVVLVRQEPLYASTARGRVSFGRAVVCRPVAPRTCWVDHQRRRRSERVAEGEP